MTKYVHCPKCEAILEVDEEGLAREMEWWELLDWKKMRKTFVKLPPEIKNKIRVALNESSEWTPKEDE